MKCDVCLHPMDEDETGYMHTPSYTGGHVACMRPFMQGWEAALAHLAGETFASNDA